MIDFDSLDKLKGVDVSDIDIEQHVELSNEAQRQKSAERELREIEMLGTDAFRLSASQAPSVLNCEMRFLANINRASENTGAITMGNCSDDIVTYRVQGLELDNIVKIISKKYLTSENSDVLGGKEVDYRGSKITSKLKNMFTKVEKLWKYIKSGVFGELRTDLCQKNFKTEFEGFKVSATPDLIFEKGGKLKVVELKYSSLEIGDLALNYNPQLVLQAYCVQAETGKQCDIGGVINIKKVPTRDTELDAKGKEIKFHMCMDHGLTMKQIVTSAKVLRTKTVETAVVRPNAFCHKICNLCKLKYDATNISYASNYSPPKIKLDIEVSTDEQRAIEELLAKLRGTKKDSVLETIKEVAKELDKPTELPVEVDPTIEEDVNMNSLSKLMGVVEEKPYKVMSVAKAAYELLNEEERKIAGDLPESVLEKIKEVGANIDVVIAQRLNSLARYNQKFDIVERSRMRNVDKLHPLYEQERCWEFDGLDHFSSKALKSIILAREQGTDVHSVEGALQKENGKTTEEFIEEKVKFHALELEYKANNTLQDESPKEFIEQSKKEVAEMMGFDGINMGYHV